MNPTIVDIAVELHGHFAPGVALGLRMSEIALLRLNMNKGNKALIGICETNRCLPDALQVASGCTLGHSNIILVNYGKLALTLANATTKEGIRVALKENAKMHSALMNNWMLRLGKLTKEEEHDLSTKLLEMEEKYFSIQSVRIDKMQTPSFENSKITACSMCNELIPSSLVTIIGEKVYCKSCSGESYYTLVKR